MKFLPNNNAIKLSAHLYVATNQNGLNNALYDYFKCDSGESYTKAEVRAMVQNYPRYNEEWHSKGHPIYPCAFVIVDRSFECGRVFIDIIPPFTFDELVHMPNFRTL